MQSTAVAPPVSGPVEADLVTARVILASRFKDVGDEQTVRLRVDDEMTTLVRRSINEGKRVLEFVT